MVPAWEEAKRRGETGSKVRVEGGEGRYWDGRGCQEEVGR
mgnify:FL=1